MDRDGLRKGGEGLGRKRDGVGVYSATLQHNVTNKKVIKQTSSMEIQKILKFP